MAEMQQVRFRAMGSEITAFLEPLSGNGLEALDLVPIWFQEWEAELSRFRETSGLSRLNRADGSPFEVSQLLWEVLLQAVELSSQTEGLVTPLTLNALQTAGYDDSFERIGAASRLELFGVHRSSADPAAIRFDPNGHSIQLPFGEKVDLGGFAKGWAADTASERLTEFGCVLIDAGGDISVNRPRLDGQPWLIGVENPLAPEEDIAVLPITNGGVATSGKNRRRWFDAKGEIYHHIIDPRTGSPAINDVLTATVVGPSAAYAEVGSKMVCILGSREGLNWIEHRSDMEALVVTENGDVHLSSQMYENHQEKLTNVRA